MSNWFIDWIYEIIPVRCAYCHKLMWYDTPKRRNRFNRRLFTHTIGYWKNLWNYEEDENSCTSKYVNEVIYK